MAWTPRRLGDRITYSSTSTAQYKSAWRRWNQGRSIRGSLSFQGGDLSMVRFSSRRSPVGYWETAVLLGHQGGTGGVAPGACDLPIDGNDFKSVRIINFEVVNRSVYNEQRIPADSPDDFYDHDIPGRFSLAVGQTYPLNPNESINLEPNSTAELNDVVSSSTSVIDGVGVSTIVSATPRKGIGIYRADGTFRTLIEPNTGQDARPGFYRRTVRDNDSNQYRISGSFEETVTFDLEFERPGGDRVIVPIGGCGLQPPGANGLTPCSGSVGACTCPDFQRVQGAVPNSAFESERRFRDWRESNAGVLSAEAPKWCKHIWSTVIQYCAGGNASALEPVRNGAYRRPRRESVYGAPSTDDRNWDTWLDNRPQHRASRELNQQRWENFRGLDGFDRQQIRRHQRQLLSIAGGIGAYERDLMTDMDYPYPNLLGSDDYQRAFPSEYAVFYGD